MTIKGCKTEAMKLLVAAQVLCFLLAPLSASAMDAGDMFDAAPQELISAQQDVPWEFYLPLGPYSVGAAVITEGMQNYPLETRVLGGIFPLGMDVTFLAVWGYTGDKLTIKITDEGDAGDRLGAIAVAQYANKTETQWGTLYSTDSQSSFDINIPVSAPGIYVYLFTWYFTPSTGTDPYTCTISCSFPQ